MLDFSNKLGQRVLERIDSEYVIWLTTVTLRGVPQPRPVWFIWEGEAFIVYSSATAKKIQHIEQNPNVSLHFNGDSTGEDIQVFLGLAQIDRDPPPAKQVKAYMEKYGQGILDIGMNEESFSAVFNWVLRIVPTRLRGIQDSLS